MLVSIYNNPLISAHIYVRRQFLMYSLLELMACQRGKGLYSSLAISLGSFFLLVLQIHPSVSTASWDFKWRNNTCH